MGCDGLVTGKRNKELTTFVEESAKDGSMATFTGVDVLGWTLTTSQPGSLTADPSAVEFPQHPRAEPDRADHGGGWRRRDGATDAGVTGGWTGCGGTHRGGDRDDQSKSDVWCGERETDRRGGRVGSDDAAEQSGLDADPAAADAAAGEAGAEPVRWFARENRKTDRGRQADYHSQRAEIHVSGNVLGLSGWLIDWLMYQFSCNVLVGSIDWLSHLIDRLIDCFIAWLVDWLIDWIMATFYSLPFVIFPSFLFRFRKMPFCRSVGQSRKSFFWSRTRSRPGWNWNGHPMAIMCCTACLWPTPRVSRRTISTWRPVVARPFRSRSKSTCKSRTTVRPGKTFSPFRRTLFLLEKNQNFNTLHSKKSKKSIKSKLSIRIFNISFETKMKNNSKKFE